MAVSLELAISAIRAGRKEEGRQLLNLLIQQNPNNEMAWLWMSSVVNTDEQKARCLYHVLAINSKNQLAQRGLQLLGIVVSDSRPVQLPRDSQPIHLPKATVTAATVTAAATDTADRRPFLIDPKTITQELPFTPVKPPFQEQKIQASPAVLALNVEEEPDPLPVAAPAVTVNGNGVKAATSPLAEPKTEPALPPVESGPPPAAPAAENFVVVYPPATETQVMPPLVVEGRAQIRPAVETAPPPPVERASAQTQVMPTLSPPPAEAAPLTDTNKLPALPPNGTAAAPPPVAFAPTPAQPGPTPVPPPMETRPSQPVYLNYPDPNAGQMPYYPPQPAPPPPPVYYSPQYPQLPVGYNPALPSAATINMQFPPAQYQRPAEPLPVAPSPGMMPYPAYPYHSNATVLMPPMSEAEARARLANSQAIPTASAAAMPLQNGGGWPPNPMLANVAAPFEDESDEVEESEGEINVLAVIIFGTLSLTALGGLGMLLLLIFTTPA